MTLAEYVLKIVAMNISHRDKLVILYLAARGAWASTAEIQAAIVSSHTTETGRAAFLKRIADRGLIEREGKRAVGYRYRVVL